MGHNICYMSVPERCNRKEVVQSIAERANRDGDGWNGPMHWHDEIPVQKNWDAAKELIKALDKGWYDDHSVRYYDHSGAEITPKIKELQDKHAALTTKLGQYEAEHSVKNLKAAYIGCPACGSTLARERLRGELCPLCQTDLRSKTTLDTIKGYRERMVETSRKIQTEMEKQKANRKIKWLVKNEYHS